MELSTSIQFKDGFVLRGNITNAAINAIFQTMKNELPEEARRADVFCYLLLEAEEQVKTLRLDV